MVKPSFTLSDVRAVLTQSNRESTDGKSHISVVPNPEKQANSDLSRFLEAIGSVWQQLRHRENEQEA